MAEAHSQSQDTLDVNRRNQRNNSTGSPSVVPLNTLKGECDSLMNPSSSGLSSFAPYLPQMYRPYDAPRKRQMRSPFDQDARQSVLRDGSKGSAENASPVNRRRPASSASSTAPTEADTLQNDRASPQSRLIIEKNELTKEKSQNFYSNKINSMNFIYGTHSRYENHSPQSTTARNGSNECSERNGATNKKVKENDEGNETNKSENDVSTFRKYISASIHDNFRNLLLFISLIKFQIIFSHRLELKICALKWKLITPHNHRHQTPHHRHQHRLSVTWKLTKKPVYRRI